MIVNISAEKIGHFIYLHLKSTGKLPKGKTIRPVEVNPDNPKKLVVVEVIDVDEVQGG